MRTAAGIFSAAYPAVNTYLVLRHLRVVFSAAYPAVNLCPNDHGLMVDFSAAYPAVNRRRLPP